MSSIVIEAATDDMPKDAFVDAVTDFLREKKLVDKFVLWLYKWKTMNSERILGKIPESRSIKREVNNNDQSL